MKKVALFFLLVSIFFVGVSSVSAEIKLLGYTASDENIVAVMETAGGSHYVKLGDSIRGYTLSGRGVIQLIFVKEGKDHYVPVGGSLRGPVSPTQKETQEVSLVNINTASFEELRSIIHIDKTRAQQIIDLREQAPFDSVRSLTRVPGIAEKRLADIKKQGIAYVD